MFEGQRQFLTGLGQVAPGVVGPCQAEVRLVQVWRDVRTAREIANRTLDVTFLQRRAASIEPVERVRIVEPVENPLVLLGLAVALLPGWVCDPILTLGDPSGADGR